MKFLSLNIRGFGAGRVSKVGWLKGICRSQKPDFVLLQETKLHMVDLQWIRALWGDINCNFIQKEMVGKSGGQLIIWDTNVFDATDVFSCDFFIGIRGTWIRSQKELNVVKVYGPHDDHYKAIFWDQLHNTISSDFNLAWVICGDFNESRMFNEFIEKSNLIDIPLGGRLFTRVSDDGLKFSKLDRFLVNEAFHNLWSRISVVALDRDKSDHCSIVLKDDDRNFGPKPIKIFDDWLDIDGMDHVIKEAWLEEVGSGSRLDCRLRNKLKKTKMAIKSKSLLKFGNLDGEIDMFKSIANTFELKAELGCLDEVERVQWLEARREWIQRDRIKVNMLKQKARI
ncbi:uncharacterized protein [Rutidosis leptorrhynchoides]|uniref:uncharacterized protein n=1 Tax=Rutidosis leptorrhynchoides TaxID=125765 RepID=UPI003A98F98C